MEENQLESLTCYLDDKAELIVKAFESVEDPQLKKIIPEVLAYMQLEDLKAECFIELFEMSKQRIRYTPEGKELDVSSKDSLVLSSDTSPESAPKLKNKRIVKKWSPVHQESHKRITSEEKESTTKMHKNSNVVSEEDREWREKLKKKKLYHPKEAKTSKNHKRKAILEKSDIYNSIRKPVSMNSSPKKHLEKAADVEKKKSYHKERDDNGKKSKKKKVDRSNHIDIKVRTSQETLVTESKESSPMFEKKPLIENDIKEVEEIFPEEKKSSINLEFTLPDPKLEARRQGGQRLLDLLELEMRAKAIKALLKREERKGRKIEVIDLDEDDDPDAVIVVQKPPEEVDLTKEDDGIETYTNLNYNKGSCSKSLRKSLEQTITATIALSDDNGCDKMILLDEPPSKKEASNKLYNLNVQKDDTFVKDISVVENRERSWAQSWLNSDKVKQILATSKAVTNIRKRLKVKHPRFEEAHSSNHLIESSPEIVGSVNEYNMLISSKKNASESQINCEKTVP